MTYDAQAEAIMASMLGPKVDPRAKHLERSPLLEQQSVWGGGSMSSVLSVMSPEAGIRWAQVVTMVSDKDLAHLRPRMEKAGMKRVGKGAWTHRKVPQTGGGKGRGGAPTRIVIRNGGAVEQVWEWSEKRPGGFQNLRVRLAMMPPPPVTPMWMDAALAAPVVMCVVPAAIAEGRLRDVHAEGDAEDVAVANAVLDDVLDEAAGSFRLWAGLVAADFGDEE
jgi:hypothetical protein